MTLTAKQTAAINAAIPARRQQMRQMFAAQNAGRVPGRNRDLKQALGRFGMPPPPPPRAPRRRAGTPWARGRGTVAIPRQMPAPGQGFAPGTAPRGFGYYDAFSNHCDTAITAVSVGRVTPITAITRCFGGGLETQKEIYVSGASNLDAASRLIIINPSASKLQVVGYNCSVGPTGLVSPADPINCELYNSPTLSDSPPVNLIPIRCSMRIKNISANFVVGGQVRILRLTTGLTLDNHQGDGVSAPANYTTNIVLAETMDRIRNHAMTETYSGKALQHSYQKNCIVVDQSKAADFVDMDLQIPTKDLPWTKAAGWPQTYGTPPDDFFTDSFTRSLHEPVYSPIAILLDPYATIGPNNTKVGNQYQIEVRSQFLGHYQQGSILGNSAFNVPSNPAALNQHRNKEEATGSMMHSVGHALMNAVHNVEHFVGNHPNVTAGLATASAAGTRAAARMAQAAATAAPEMLEMGLLAL